MAKRNEMTAGSFGIVLLCICAIAAIGLVIFQQHTFAESYYDNTTILTKLNVSNVGPVVYDVVLYDNNTPGNIQLEQGTTHIVVCNGSVNDSNGYQDVAYLNATIYRQGRTADEAADNNYLYWNTSCRRHGSNGVVTGYWTCKFDVWFYADNGTWVCNMTALDNSSVANRSTTTKDIDPLFAINLSTSELDFGELEPSQSSSSDELVNITNWGNMNLSIATKAYAETDGDNQAMKCSIGNISLSYLKYSVESAQNFGDMTESPGSFGNIAGLTVYRRTDDADAGNLKNTNATYWKIQAPLGTKGVCNGSLVFSAVGS
jgi:hypothetical protein